MNRPIGSQSIPSRGATAGRALRWSWASLASVTLACTALKEGDKVSPDARDDRIDASTVDATAVVVARGPRCRAGDYDGDGVSDLSLLASGRWAVC